MEDKAPIISELPLIKFQDKDKIDSIRKGKIYMKSLKWYREHENEDGNTIVGDEFEGVLYLSDAKLFFPTTNELINVQHEAVQTSFSNDFVFCMFGMYPNKTSFKFSKEQKDELSTFGNTALIITNREEFIRRMIEKAQEENIKIYNDFVRYYSNKTDNINIIHSLTQGMQNIAFWKRDRYILQQEYRFLLHSVNTENDHYILDIGDISQISTVIDTTSVLNSTIDRLL